MSSNLLRYLPIYVGVAYYLLATLLNLYVTSDGGHVLDTADWLVDTGVWASNRTSYPEDYSSHFLYVVMLSIGKLITPMSTLQVSYVINAIAIGITFWIYTKFHSNIIAGVALILSGGFYLGLVSFSTPVLMAFYAIIMYILLKPPFLYSWVLPILERLYAILDRDSSGLQSKLGFQTGYRLLFVMVFLATLFRWESVLLCSGLLACEGYQAYQKQQLRKFLRESLNLIVPLIAYCIARYLYFGTVLGEDGGTIFNINYGMSHLWVVLFSVGLAIPLLKNDKLYLYLATAIPASALFWMINVVGSQAARYYAPLVVIATILVSSRQRFAAPILMVVLSLIHISEPTRPY